MIYSVSLVAVGGFKRMPQVPDPAQRQDLRHRLACNLLDLVHSRYVSAGIAQVGSGHAKLARL